MNQKLSDWASVAEILASIAVVITLIMLSVGVRENTEVVRASSYNDLLGNVDEQAHLILDSERLTTIWRLREGVFRLPIWHHRGAGIYALRRAGVQSFRPN